jgi:hypothetical protein
MVAPCKLYFTIIIPTPPHPHVFGWLLCAPLSISSHLRPGVFSCHHFLVAQFDKPNNDLTSSHMLRPGCYFSKTSLTPQPPMSVDCCIFILKQWPPKAKVLHISLNSTCYLINNLPSMLLSGKKIVFLTEELHQGDMNNSTSTSKR